MGSIRWKISRHTGIFATHSLLSLLIPKKYSLLEAYKLKEAVMKVVQVPEPLWAEMTQPLGRPLGAK